MRKFFLSALLLIAFLSVLPTSSLAAGPITHVGLTREALGQCDSNICQMIKKYPDLCYAGLMVPDSSIMKYYSEYPIGKKYLLSHNWNYIDRGLAQSETEDMKVFWYCQGIHEVQDGIFHNYYIPDKLKSGLFFIPVHNWLGHPLFEGFIEAYNFKVNPTDADIAQYSMDILFQPGNEKYLDSVQKAMGVSESEFNVRDEAWTLRTFLGAGKFEYGYYNVPAGSWMRSLYNFLGSILGGVGSGEAKEEMQFSVDYTVKTLNSWGSRIALDPAGYDALSSADAYPNIILTVLIIVTVVVVMWRLGIPVWEHFKK